MANFFRKKSKIQLFVRHCYFSSASHKKERYRHFDRIQCFQNLLATLDEREVNLTFFLDTFYQGDKKHFLLEQKKYPVIEIKAGNEAASFLKMLDYVIDQGFGDETLLYFLEDDYLHRPGWVKILKEGFTLPFDYLTLYDHRDKYFLPLYENLQSKIFHTESCHWRTTPSTTNTYAMRYQTLLRDLDIHRAFSLNRKISADHEKFCLLNEKGASLISPMPGWSTHAEPKFASPCFNWEEMFIK